jgi:molybdate transport system substrate-binding protein
MKRRMLWGCVVAAIVSLGFARVPPTLGADKATLNVFAAASLADAFTEIGHNLEKQRPGLTVRMNFAGSQALALQIEQGAAADVFASADERWMSYARDHGLVDGDASIFARNRLVVIVPKTNPARISKLKDLSRRGTKLVIGADAVPVGRYSRTVLKNLSKDPAYGDDFATQVLRNVVSEEENVKSVVGKVQLGEADAGMVYRSDVTPAISRYVKVFEIPERANVVASYPIAPVKEAKNADVAKAFIDLVTSDAGQKVLESHGLMRAEAPAPAATP